MARKRQPIEQTYNPEEVADYCRVHRRSVYRWLADGSLQASKAGEKKWVITQTQLDAFLKKPQLKKPKEKPLENKPEPEQQPELPAELLPTGSGELSPLPEPVKQPWRTEYVTTDDQDDDNQLPYDARDAMVSAMLPGSDVVARFAEPELQLQPEQPHTWKGKKRPKRA